MRGLTILLTFFLLFFFITDTFPQFEESSVGTHSNVSSKKLLYPKFSELIEASRVDLGKYILVDKFEAIEALQKTNFTVVTFKGRINAIHQDKKLRCNRLTAIIVDNEVREIVGEGNVKFVSGKDLFEGDKFFYDLRVGKVSLYNAKTKIDEQYYYADIVKQLSQDRFFFENVFFTKNDLFFPTYKINAYRVWYYKNDYLLSLNNSYFVGSGSFLYLPTYFELYRYTDILTDFGLETTLGFYIQNTFYPKNWFGEKILPRLKIKFDHYERLGEYVGFEAPNINIISNLTISAIVDFEYDKKYEVYGNYIVNFIDQYGKRDYREYRTFGWNYNLKLNYSSSGTSISFSTEDLNDPYLPTKFSFRRERFDVRRFLLPYENRFWIPPGPKQNITRNLRINYQYGISSFSLGLDWIYNLRSGYSITNTNSFDIVTIENKTNKYANDYYRYDLQRLSGPYISYSANLGKLLSFSYEEKKTNVLTNLSTTTNIMKCVTNESVKSRSSFEMDLITIRTNFTTNIGTNLMLSGEGKTNYSIVTNIVESITTNFVIDTNLISKPAKGISQKFQQPSFTTNISSIKWISFGVTPSASISIHPNSVYRIEDGTPLEDTFNHKESVGVNGQLLLFNDLFNLNSSINIQNNSVWTRTQDILRRKQDDLNSLATLNMGNSLSVSRNLFSKSVFNSDFTISSSHNLSYRLTKPKLLSPDEDPYVDNVTSHSIGASISLKLLDLSILSNVVLNFLGFSSISLSSGVSYNLLYLKNEIRYRDDKHYWTNKISNPVSLNISLGPWLNYRISYRVKVSNENTVFDPVLVSLSGGISAKDLYLGVVIQKLTYLSLSYGLLFDYVNPINNNFTLNFSAMGMIDEHWSFTITTSVVNNKLYRYVSEYAQKYNVPQVDLVRDIIDAVNIFNIDALRRTLFKNKGVTISLLRDLYDWTASLSGGIRLYKDEVRNFAFFEPFVEFKVTSKKSVGIEVPPIQPELYKLFE
ncbi:MAG: hypothetical protein ABDH28_00150 [Brevinematia bacterium]